jgi:phenylacetate-CoA ligase
MLADSQNHATQKLSRSGQATTLSPSKFQFNLHPANCVYIAPMLATPELIRETAQLSRLAELLPRWRHVPLYRDALGGDTDFSRLPLLGKREMRTGFPHNFLPAEPSLDDLLENRVVELEHTSGSTEERLPVVFGKGWWDAQEQRALRLNPFVAKILDEHPHARRVAIVPPNCNGLTCPRGWMSREERTLGNTLYINLDRIPFVLGDAKLARMAAEVTEWAPQFLDLDPVHGAWFALYCEKHGIQFPSLKFILCSYEFVSVVHRRILERVFRVPVFNLYGSTETGHLLMENERGEMKASLDTAFLEVVEPDVRDIGHLVVTTLSNDYMPLLRYRIGDLVEQRTRSRGTNYIVHGRAAAALTSADGQRVTTWDVDQCFTHALGIVHYELRQYKNGDAILCYIPEGTGPTQETLSNITSQFKRC